MESEKLELIKILSQYDRDELQKILIIMTYWEDMIKEGIVNEKDLDNIVDLPIDKQNKIKEFVTQKLEERIKQNGRK